MRRALLAAVVFTLGLTPAFAQSAEQERPHARLAMTADAITLDGVPDEPARQQAEPITAFVQQEPEVGTPASHRTEVRILGGSEALYFAIRCADDRRVTARERRRDNAMADDDRFEIALDTFHDHRNAYHFAINPLATQYDALSRTKAVT